jgi:hypothetical protein
MSDRNDVHPFTSSLMSDICYQPLVRYVDQPVRQLIHNRLFGADVSEMRHYDRVSRNLLTKARDLSTKTRFLGGPLSRTHPRAPPVLYKTNTFSARDVTLATSHPKAIRFHTRRSAAAARRRLALLLALTAVLPAVLLLLSTLLASTRARAPLAALAALPASL